MSARGRAAAWAAGALLVVAAALSVWWAASVTRAPRGDVLFSTSFTPAQGLGPLYNETSCVACHNTPTVGGTGPNGLASVLRVGQLTASSYDPMVARGGPVARGHAIAELGDACSLSPGVPPGANITSVRNAPALFGAGLIDAIPDKVILAGAVAREDGIAGRPNYTGGRIGRFGWKADGATLEAFVSEAFRNELGLTSPLAPSDHVGGCNSDALDLDAGTVEAVSTFVATFAAPAPTGVADPSVFERVGCTSCHQPQLGEAPLYSDLLLHDMGRALDDGIVQGLARGQDWRTTPLWGLRLRSRFLHDGRAQSVEAAILAHSGEAEPVIQRFRALSATERAALLAFLGTL